MQFPCIMRKNSEVAAETDGFTFPCRRCLCAESAPSWWGDKRAQSLAAWDCPHGTGLFGLWKQYTYTGSEEILSFLSTWHESRISLGALERNVNPADYSWPTSRLGNRRPPVHILQPGLLKAGNSAGPAFRPSFSVTATAW